MSCRHALLSKAFLHDQHYKYELIWSPCAGLDLQHSTALYERDQCQALSAQGAPPVHHHESDVSKTSSSSQFPSHDSQDLKSSQPHAQLIVVNNLEGIPASVSAVNPWKLCLQEILHCSFSACSSRPRTSSRSGSSRAPQWTHAANISSSERSMSFQRQQDTDLCYPDTASLEKRIEKVSSDAMIMSVDRLLRGSPRSLYPPVRPKFLSLSGDTCRSGCLRKHATGRPKLKSPYRAPGKIVLRQGLPPPTKSAVKARHDSSRSL